MRPLTESMLFVFVFFAAFFILCCTSDLKSTYTKIRESFIQDEINTSLGGKIRLTTRENLANDVLMYYKQKELDFAFKNPQYFNFSKNFLEYKNDVNNSTVYKIIRKMPKGALLHAHSTLLLGEELLKFTYEDDLYACYENDDLKMLQFSRETPHEPCVGNWTLLSDIRTRVDDITTFDKELMKHFTMNADDIKLLNADVDTIWHRFNEICDFIKHVINYRPVREKFIFQSLKKLYEDNVLYAELRTGLPNLFELNGTVHDKIYTIRLYNEVIEEFKTRYPDFVGAKLILTKRRTVTHDALQGFFQLTRRIRREVPGIIVGVDLVAQEDKGFSIKEHLPSLKDVQDLAFFFHAGETNWYGSPTDENLIDAILLGSRRIGHAYALIKHPKLTQEIVKRGIGLEVNLISNSILGLVRDVRNHPLASYLALNLPVTLNSDDPGVWGADPLSHDFYVAFVGVASRHADIRMLKKLAFNSIRYSAIGEEDGVKLKSVFMRRWKKFVKYLLRLNNGQVKKLNRITQSQSSTPKDCLLEQ